MRFVNTYARIWKKEIKFMNIGILCSDKEKSAKIVKIVNHVFFDKDIIYRIINLSKDESLIKKLTVFDIRILIIDISLSEIQGMSITKYLRSNEIEPLVIYISDNRFSLEHLFDINVFACINIYNIIYDLKKVINDCVNYIQLKSLYFKVEDGYEYVDIKGIIYIDYFDRKTWCHLKNKTFRIFDESLISVYQKLNSYNFVYINRSTIINLNHLVKFKNGLIYMNYTNKALSLSKDKERKLIDIIITL